MVSTEEFIEVLKTYEIIWNKQHFDYKNRKKKAVIWSEISEKVGLSVEDSKKKWKGLRDSFSRENSKPKKTSSQEAEGPQERWQYFHHLKFLKENINPRATIRNYSAASTPKEVFPSSLTVEEWENVDEYKALCEEAVMRLPQSRSSSDIKDELDSSQNSFNTPRAKKRRSDSDTIESNLLQTLKSIDVFLNTQGRENSVDSEDEDSLFCKCLTKKLKKFPLNKKNELKIKLLQLLNEEEEKLFS